MVNKGTKIKVIKKNSIKMHKHPFRPGEEVIKPKSKPVEATQTIENWVAEWRQRTQIKARNALGELLRSRAEDSTGM